MQKKQRNDELRNVITKIDEIKPRINTAESVVKEKRKHKSTRKKGFYY